MPKCPKCGKEINSFLFSASQDCGGSAYLDGSTFQHSTDEVSGSRDEEYRCPECQELLTREPDEAEQFLQGKIKLEDKAKIPQCPFCHELIAKIGTTKGIMLIFKNGKWKQEAVSSDEEIYVCSSCLEEFYPENLDALGVPNDIR